MCVSRIDEVVELLTAFALGELDLPKERLVAALALLDLGISDAVPPDGDGDEMPPLAAAELVPVYRPKLVA